MVCLCCENIKSVFAFEYGDGWMQYIPVGVIKKCSDIACLKELKLEDPQGRSWHVNLCHRKKPSSAGSGIHIGKGWQEFVRGNKLQVGDRCVFKFLSEGKEKVVHVRIIHEVD